MSRQGSVIMTVGTSKLVKETEKLQAMKEAAKPLADAVKPLLKIRKEAEAAAGKAVKAVAKAETLLSRANANVIAQQAKVDEIKAAEKPMPVTVMILRGPTSVEAQPQAAA